MSKEKSNSMKQLKYSIALPLATVTMFLLLAVHGPIIIRRRAMLQRMIRCLPVRLILCILCCTSRRYP